jgi:hypothetical protein
MEMMARRQQARRIGSGKGAALQLLRMSIIGSMQLEACRRPDCHLHLGKMQTNRIRAAG